MEAGAGPARPADPKAPAPAASSKKIQVDDFRISNAKLKVTLTDLGGRTMALTLPEIHLSGLGQGADGITPAELIKRGVSAITSTGLEAVSAAMKDLGKDLARDPAGEAGKIGKSVTDLFKKK